MSRGFHPAAASEAYSLQLPVSVASFLLRMRRTHPGVTFDLTSRYVTRRDAVMALMVSPIAPPGGHALYFFWMFVVDAQKESKFGQEEIVEGVQWGRQLLVYTTVDRKWRQIAFYSIRDRKPEKRKQYQWRGLACSPAWSFRVVNVSRSNDNVEKNDNAIKK